MIAINCTRDTTWNASLHNYKLLVIFFHPFPWLVCRLVFLFFCHMALIIPNTLVSRCLTISNSFVYPNKE